MNGVNHALSVHWDHGPDADQYLMPIACIMSFPNRPIFSKNTIASGCD